MDNWWGTGQRSMKLCGHDKLNKEQYIRIRSFLIGASNKLWSRIFRINDSIYFLITNPTQVWNSFPWDAVDARSLCRLSDKKGSQSGRKIHQGFLYPRSQPKDQELHQLQAVGGMQEKYIYVLALIHSFLHKCYSQKQHNELDRFLAWSYTRRVTKLLSVQDKPNILFTKESATSNQIYATPSIILISVCTELKGSKLSQKVSIES